MMHEFTIDRQDSPLGELFIVHDSTGCLRALEFSDHEHRLHRLLSRYYGADAYRLMRARAEHAIRDAIAAYFEGELTAIDALQTAVEASAFQGAVWAALREIPCGTTTSYGALAARLGCPGGARAVGLANGANPIGIVVPCHRVIGADGSLTGYGGGIQRKHWLLVHEGARAGQLALW